MKINKIFALLLVFFSLCAGQNELELAKNAYAQRDFKKAFLLYQKSCNKGDLYACYALALAYRDGDGVAKDSKKAYEMLDSLCAKSVFGACFSLGDFFEQDYQKASLLYQKACDGEHIGACYKLATLLRSHGESQKALRLYEKICQSGEANSCAFAGEIYQKSNATLSQKYYQKACALGLMLACEKVSE